MWQINELIRQVGTSEGVTPGRIFFRNLLH